MVYKKEREFNANVWFKLQTSDFKLQTSSNFINHISDKCKHQNSEILVVLASIADKHNLTLVDTLIILKKTKKQEQKNKKISADRIHCLPRWGVTIMVSLCVGKDEKQKAESYFSI